MTTFNDDERLLERIAYFCEENDQAALYTYIKGREDKREAEIKSSVSTLKGISGQLSRNGYAHTSKLLNEVINKLSNPQATKGSE